MEQKRIKVRLTENSPYSDYGYYKKGDIGYIDGYVNDSAVIILENGKFAKADLRWIEVVNEEDKNVNTVLKESEDEKIRKGLIQYFNTFTLDTFAGLEPKKILAWLEKQGEHAKFCDSIQVGDKVTRNQDGVLVNISQLERVSKPADKVVTNLLTVERAKEISPFMRSGFEQKPTDKVEPKFKVGDKIIHKELGGDFIHNPHKIIQVDILDKKYRLEGGLVAHFDEQDDYELVEQNNAWSKDDEQYLLVCKNALAKYQVSDKWDAGIISRWLEDKLKSLKDRVQPQPKQEWSEEDEQTFIKSVEALEDFGKFELADWLKEHKNQFLRPQSTWKPSERQKEALLWCVVHLGGADKQTLGELLEELNKL